MSFGEAILGDMKKIKFPKKFIAVLAASVTVLLITGWALDAFTTSYHKATPITADTSLLTPLTVGQSSTQNSGYASTDNAAASNATLQTADLMIKQWGVQLSMIDAGEVTYSYSPKCNDPRFGQCDSSVVLAVKPSALIDKTCNLAVNYERFANQPKSNPQITAKFTKIGSYYYYQNPATHNPCSDTYDGYLNMTIRASIGPLEAY